MISEILQGLLAVVYLMAGGMKLMKSKENMASKMPWVNDFSQSQIKMIGGLEVLAALGLVVGLFLDLTVLTQVSAGLMALLMIGATYTHIRRKENSNTMMTGVLLVIAAWIALTV